MLHSMKDAVIDISVMKQDYDGACEAINTNSNVSSLTNKNKANTYKSRARFTG